MTVQLVIVNYNAGDWLAKSIGSALEHSTAHITVVDNASVDDSVKHCQQLFNNEARLTWIENSSNLGFAAANNQVLGEVQTASDYLVLMNPDCELQTSTLSLIFDAFAMDSKIGLASCRILNSDGSLQATCRRRFPTPATAAIRLLGLSRFFPASNFDFGDSAKEGDGVQKIEAVSGAFMVVRKAALDEVGLLDEGYFMHCEDLDWCKRFQQHGWDVAFVSQAAVLHAKGVSSRSRPIGVLWNLHRGMDRFFKKFYSESNDVMTLLVRAGIYLSFLPRALLTLVRSS